MADAHFTDEDSIQAMLDAGEDAGVLEFVGDDDDDPDDPILYEFFVDGEFRILVRRNPEGRIFWFPDVFSFRAGANIVDVLTALSRNMEVYNALEAGYAYDAGETFIIISIEIISEGDDPVMNWLPSARGELRNRAARTARLSYIRAFHNFAYRSTDTAKYSIAPLRLKDMSCIYESLCIINAHYDWCLTHTSEDEFLIERLTQQWTARVSIDFSNEPQQMIDLCVGGRIAAVVDLFNQVTQKNIELVLFDSSFFKDSFSDAEQIIDETPNSHVYFLYYEHDHVYPYTIEGLREKKISFDKLMARLNQPSKPLIIRSKL